MSKLDLDQLVNLDEGLINRHLLVDPEVYKLEIERIFSRSWLFLAHDSQLKQNGDYITSFMAEDPIVVVRGHDGKVRAFLNSCRHRGNRICRSDMGNTGFFRCAFHGWTYRNDGKLNGVPFYEKAYGKKIDMSQFGLIEVPRVESYKGMYFGNWDNRAPSLNESLGDFKFYLDLLLDRFDGEWEVAGGVRKFSVGVNWKLHLEENYNDHYHVPYTHQSTIAVTKSYKVEGDGFCISTRNGHIVSGEFSVSLPELKNEISKRTYDNLKKKNVPEIVQKMTPLGSLLMFPNVGMLDRLNFFTIRVCHPRGPNKTDTYSWQFVPKHMPAEERRKLVDMFVFVWGMNYQDDSEIQSQVQSSARGWISTKQFNNYQLGLHREKPASEFLGEGLPGITDTTDFSEFGQIEFYRHWLRLMTSKRSA